MGGAEATRIVRMKLPRAMRFDLDDTILVSFGPAQSHWQRTEATAIAAAIEASTALWADPARHDGHEELGMAKERCSARLAIDARNEYQSAQGSVGSLRHPGSREVSTSARIGPVPRAPPPAAPASPRPSADHW